MNTGRQAQLTTPTLPVVGAENHKVSWEDQDVADAFVEKGASHGVTISPDTAMDLAKEVRGKVKQGDDLEVQSIISEIMDKLFPKSTDTATTKATLDALKVIGNRIAKYRKIFAQESGPIGPEEETELRAGVLNDVLMPLQDEISDTASKLTRQYFKELLPIRTEKMELEKYLKDTTKIEALEADVKANPTDKAKRKALKAEQAIIDQKARKAFELLLKENILQSKLIRLNKLSGYVDFNTTILDQYHGVDGMTSFFDKALQPALTKIREAIMNVRRNIVLPEVTEKTRHEREWLLRHHLTKTYQNGQLPPSLDKVDFDSFKAGPVYAELHKEGIKDENIEAGIEHLNALPMTWRKGQAIYMLLDPPAEKTIHQDIPTMMTDAPKSWGSELIANQPFNVEKGKFEEQKDKMEKNTRPKGMTKERKISEAANENAHWSVLFNLSRNQRVDASGKTRAEHYIDSLPSTVKDKIGVAQEAIAASKKMNKSEAGSGDEYLNRQDASLKAAIEASRNAEKMEDEDHLHDQEIINAALWNPSTPDWVLMKAATTGYADQIRRVAKAILERKRGWQLRLDEEGHKIKDAESNDYIWERIPGFDVAASWSPLKVLGQAVPGASVQMSTPQAASSTQQSLKNQIQTADTNIQNHQSQIQQIQVQKQNFQNQLNAIPPAAQQTTTPPTNTTSPAQQATEANNAPVDSNNPPPVDNLGVPTQPMAAEHISFRKFSDMLGLTDMKDEEDTEFEEPQQPEEGDFVYDNGSSSLSIAGEHFIGHFVEWDDVERAIRDYAHKHNFYPSVWQLSDHGNYHLVTDFNYGEKPAAKSEQPWYRRV